MNTLPNRRILLIDDMRSIHEDFRKILNAGPSFGNLDAMEASLLGEAQPDPGEPFELDSAYQGQEGLQRVEAAVKAGRPYALAFVDMRMPPGWDGAETIERLWRADPELQIVICTAYSDHAWEDMLSRLDVQDRLLIVKKPFDIIEISQLARTLSAKWALKWQSGVQLNSLEMAMSELKTVEGALRISNRELEAFSYSVAHDLRAPLATIDGFSNLLATRIASNDDLKAQHYLSRIRASVRQMEQLIEAMMALAQVARIQLQYGSVDLGAMSSDILGTLQAGAPQRKSTINVDAALLVQGDQRLMRIVMENLLGNAWKFTSRQAHTEIVVGQIEDHGEEPVFFVRDNGAGFDMAHADRLFDTFQRLHNDADFAGTGIGLATVGRVIERHGGRIWADSQPGQGATFFFTLAAHQASSALPVFKDSRFGVIA